MAINWKALEANYQPMQISNAAPAPQKRKNFLLDQISTVGGILGGIGGSFIAPLAGTAGGAAAGSGLGEAIENLITGDSVTKNVGKEAALGGVFGAGPIKLLKGGAALAGGKGIQAASQAAMTPLRQAAGQSLVNASDNLATKAFRLTPTQLTNFKSKFGEDAGQVIKRYGFQNADDIAVKGIEPIQQQFDDLIQGVPGVTKDSLKKNIMYRVNRLSSSGPSDTKALAGQLKKEANDLLKPFGDVIDAKELNTIRRQFDDLVNYTEKAANPARYGVNKRMADAIRETLQKADPTGSLKDVGRELQKLRQLSDNAARQSNLGRGSLPLGLGGLLGGATGGIAGGPGGAVGGILATQAINSPTGRRALSKGTEAAAGKLMSAPIGQTRKGIAARVGGQSLLRSSGPQQQPSLEDAVLDQSFLENSASMSANPTTAAPITNPMLGSLSSEMGEMSSPFSRQQALEAMLIDIQTTGGKNISKIQSLFDFANPKTNEAKPLGGEARNRALKAESGLRSIGTLESTLARDPGAYQRQALPNPLGVTARLTGTTDVRAATDNVVDVIARLRSGAAITDAEAARFARLLPQAGDSQESASRKLLAIRTELESYLDPTNAPSSLEEALMAYQ